MVSIKVHSQENKVIRNSIILAIIIFLASSVFGYITKLDFNKIEFYPDFKTIFTTNSRLSIILIIGILSFGVVSLALLCINGFYFGAALEYSVNSIGIGKTLRILVPHAIFEIPSILLSSSIGFILILLIIQKAHSDIKLSFGYYFKYICSSITLILMLNLVAAIAEVTLSM